MTITKKFTMPIVPLNVTTAERDAFTDDGATLDIGAMVFNVETRQLEVWAGSEWISFQFDPSEFDAVVDDSFIQPIWSNVFSRIEDAIDAGSRAILIRSSGDLNDITIASDDAVERIAGVDLDVLIPVNITCNKPGMLFENFQLASKTLTLSASDIETRRLKITATGKVLTEAGSADCTMRDTIVDSHTSGVAIEIAGSPSGFTINGVVSKSCTGVSVIKITSAGLNFTLGNFRGLTNACTGYVIDVVALTSLPTIRDVQIHIMANGGIRCQAIEGLIMTDIRLFGSISSGAHGIELIDSILPEAFLSNVHIAGSMNSGSKSFQYTGGTAPKNFSLNNVSWQSGAIVCVEGMVLNGCVTMFGGASLDIASKTGVVVNSGEILSVANENTGDYKTATQFHGVRGQRDRGWFPSVRVTDAGTQLINHATFTAVNFDTERWDNDSMHDNATNNTRLTCKTAGTYHIEANMAWQAWVVANPRLLGIRLSTGSVFIARVVQESVPGGIFGTEQHVSCDYQLAINEYVEMVVYEYSGVSLFVTKFSEITPEFSMTRIGE